MKIETRNRMMKNILLFSLQIFFFISSLNSVAWAALMIQDDFEEGANWSYSANGWDLHGGYLSDEWTITTSDPHGGRYCAQSEPPGSAYIEDSSFHFSVNSDEVFIKFWAKFPSNINSSNVGTNFFRYGTGAEGNWTNGGEYDIQDRWLYIYSDRVRSPGISLSTDSSWHEYAFFMDFSAGIWRSWKDARGDYSIGNATDNYTDVNYARPFDHILMPWYFKGDPGNYLWWIDDIEVWDGMPDGNIEPPPALPVLPETFGVTNDRW